MDIFVLLGGIKLAWLSGMFCDWLFWFSKIRPVVNMVVNFVVKIIMTADYCRCAMRLSVRILYIM